MNKIVIGSIVAVLVIGGISIFLLNQSSSNTAQTVETTTPATVSRPTVQAVPNTFTIMTPEEKAAADEAKRLADEAAAAATDAASTSETEVETEVELETETN